MFAVLCCIKEKRWNHFSKEFEKQYELQEQIGEGKTGQVFKAIHRKTGAIVAVKTIRNEYLTTSSRQEAFQQEINILKKIKHPSILKLIDIFQDKEKYFIVTERITGGEILNLIYHEGTMTISEQDLAQVIKELIQVLVYLHDQKITHRDIKLENILCRGKKITNGLCLIDFGLAHQDQTMSGMNGTCHYMAPEIFGKDSVYDNKIDIWAVGIVLFALLCGCFPFDDKFMSRVEDKIQEGKYEFPQEIDEAISNDAKKFVAYLLQVNPKDRPSAKVVLQHPWLQPNGASAIPFSSQHMHKIRDFAALRLQVHGKYVPPPSTIP